MRGEVGPWFRGNSENRVKLLGVMIVQPKRGGFYSYIYALYIYTANIYILAEGRVI